MTHVKDTLEHCRKQFPLSGYALASVPTYPCGQIGFIIGSLDTTNINQNLSNPKRCFTNEELDTMNLRYYTSDIHRSAFTLPRFAEKQLQ